MSLCSPTRHSPECLFAPLVQGPLGVPTTGGGSIIMVSSGDGGTPLWELGTSLCTQSLLGTSHWDWRHLTGTGDTSLLEPGTRLCAPSLTRAGHTPLMCPPLSTGGSHSQEEQGEYWELWGQTTPSGLWPSSAHL